MKANLCKFIAMVTLLPLAGCSDIESDFVIEQVQASSLTTQPSDARSGTFTHLVSDKARGPAEVHSLKYDQANDAPAYEITAIIEPGKCQRGHSVTCQITIDVQEGWRICALWQGANNNLPTSLNLNLPEWLQAEEEWIEPDATARLTSYGPEWIYTGKTTFTKRLHIATSAPEGAQTIVCEVETQATNAERSLPPSKVSLSIPLVITSE